MDRIFIRNLELNTLIGVHEWEAETRQPIIIHLELVLPDRRRRKPGDLASTVDYAEVARQVGTHVEAGKFLLLEDLAEELATLLLREFKLAEAIVQLSKPNALPGAAGVGFRIRRRAGSRRRGGFSGWSGRRRRRSPDR